MFYPSNYFCRNTVRSRPNLCRLYSRRLTRSPDRRGNTLTTLRRHGNTHCIIISRSRLKILRTKVSSRGDGIRSCRSTVAWRRWTRPSADCRHPRRQGNIAETISSSSSSSSTHSITSRGRRVCMVDHDFGHRHRTLTATMAAISGNRRARHTGQPEQVTANFRRRRRPIISLPTATSSRIRVSSTALAAWKTPAEATDPRPRQPRWRPRLACKQSRDISTTGGTRPLRPDTDRLIRVSIRGTAFLWAAAEMECQTEDPTIRPVFYTLQWAGDNPWRRRRHRYPVCNSPAVLRQ